VRHESGWITLDPAEFYLLWTELQLGEPPVVLGIAPIGRTASARGSLIEAADRALTGRDLGRVSQPPPDLEDLLLALASPKLSLDLEITGAATSFRALGVDGPRGAVTAGTAGEEVQLGPVRAPALAATMLEAAGSMPAGTGSPGNVRIADFSRACRAGESAGADGFLGVLRHVGVRPPEANTVLRAVTGARAGGRFGASARGRGDSWIRTPATVNWVDTDDGRYALRRNGDWVTVTPVDPPRLLSMTEEMVAAVA
jgi:hypothetical protein